MNGVSIVSFIFFVGFLAFVSWFKSRKGRVRVNTLSGLFLANRSLSFLFVGGGLLLANINTATIIGENELVYTNNMTVMAWGMTSVLAMLIVSEFFMPIYLRTGIATTPDFLKARYDGQTGAIVSFIFLISYVVNLLPSVLYASAVAFNGLFRFSELFRMDYWMTIWVLVWVMGTVGCLYAILGGMKAISVSDSLLGLGMFGGCLLIPFLALRYLGHGSIRNGLHIVLSSQTGHLNSIGSPADAIPFSTLFTGMLLVNLYYWGTEQYIVQQVLASKNLESSQKGIAVACAGKIISPLLLNVPGLIAVHLFSHISNTAEVFPKLDRLVSPPFIAGYIAAIIFSAGLSTFNAGLNSSSTLFVLNVYKPRLQRRGGELNEAHLVRVARRFEILVCLAAMFIAPFIIFAKRGFYTYVQTVNGFFNVPIFTIIFIGFVTKRVPPVAAKVGLVFFILAYGLTQLVFTTKIHFLHILALLFLLTSLIMLIIGKLFPMPVPYRQQLNNLVSIDPWKNRHYYSLLLLFLMALMFVLFSPVGLAK